MKMRDYIQALSELPEHMMEDEVTNVPLCTFRGAPFVADNSPDHGGPRVLIYQNGKGWVNISTLHAPVEPVKFYQPRLQYPQVTRNAVVVQVFDELRDKAGELKTATHIECINPDLRPKLDELAKAIVQAVKS